MTTMTTGVVPSCVAVTRLALASFLAREGFLRDLLDQLAGDMARAIGTDLDADNRDDLLADLRDSADALPPGTVGRGRATLDSPVAVLAVSAAKGLEFDGVVVVEPADILAGSPRGANDLYVALTRPTQRLLVLHSADLPAGLDTLAPA